MEKKNMMETVVKWMGNVTMLLIYVAVMTILIPFVLDEDAPEWSHDAVLEMLNITVAGDGLQEKSDFELVKMSFGYERTEDKDED